MSNLLHQRILVKFSGESVAGDDEHGIDPKILDHMASSVAACKEIGAQIGIVIGGGNLFRGEKLNKAGMDRVAGDHMGMLATVINALAMQDSLESLGQPVRVMSALQINQVCEDFKRRRAIRHFEKGRVVIFAAGTGNPFFTTDSAASLRGVEIEADLLIKATKVDGIYSADPVKEHDAKFLSRISFDEALDLRLKVMDATAIVMCRDNNLPLRVFNLLKPNTLVTAMTEEMIGTSVNA